MSSRNKGRDARNSIILGELLINKDMYQIHFYINGVRVFNNFYFKSTGRSKIPFNSALNYETNRICAANDEFFANYLKLRCFHSFRQSYNLL